jgi:D-alanyl-D-alanine carboxypeptidase
MTVMLAKEILQDEDVVTIPAAALDQVGESGILAGETFTFETLAAYTLLTSSNDGAYALAAAAGTELDSDEPANAFVQAMNIRSQELELSQTYFRNPTGLDLTETEAGAYGSARDVAFLLSYIINNYADLLEATTDRETAVFNLVGSYHSAENTNPVVNQIAGLLASKTGYTTLAGGNLAVAFEAGINRPVVVVVLKSSYQGRFSDVLALVDAVRTKLAQE